MVFISDRVLNPLEVLSGRITAISLKNSPLHKNSPPIRYLSGIGGLFLSGIPVIDKLRRFLFSSKCIQIASDNGGIDICFDFAIGMTIPRLCHGL